MRIDAQRNKYGNRPVIIDGLRFASRREGNQYTELKLLERAGKIRELQTQVRYKLEVNGILISTYVADFKFYDVEKKVWRVTDAKGFVTDVFRIKKKLMQACYGIEVEEV